MSRTCWFFLAAVLAPGLAACGNNKSEQENPAEPPPAKNGKDGPAPPFGSEDFQKRVNDAIAAGVKTIKAKQKKDTGTWERLNTGEYGMTGICAWTLLEAGVPADDPAVQKAIHYLRDQSLNQEHTYDIAVGVIFFDKLGQPQDIPRIEALSAQLLAGQHHVVNMWHYHCPALIAKEKALVLEAVQKAEKQAPAVDPLKGEKKVRPVNPFVYPLLFGLGARHAASNDQDNSNTQFAMMALWVARRHGLPVDKALTRVDQHFRKTQDQSGGWGYSRVVASGISDPPSPSMTCAGLLGLALGNGVKKEPIKDLRKDGTVKKGLKALTAFVAKLAEKKNKYFDETRHSLYILWSLERMAVVYDLHKDDLGGRAWYQWGAELLVNDYRQVGAWIEDCALADTCFAILFLKRANVAKDLKVEFFNPISK